MTLFEIAALQKRRVSFPNQKHRRMITYLVLPRSGVSQKSQKLQCKCNSQHFAFKVIPVVLRPKMMRPFPIMHFLSQ